MRQSPVGLDLAWRDKPSTGHWYRAWVGNGAVIPSAMGPRKPAVADDLAGDEDALGLGSVSHHHPIRLGCNYREGFGYINNNI